MRVCWHTGARDMCRFNYGSKKGAITMASIKLIPGEEATGKVKDIYEEIKSQLGIDFVPISTK